MAHRLSRITTRTGDQGTTGLATGERVAKSSPRILAMGAVDELNSWIGLVLSQGATAEVRDCLAEAQQALFEAGAELSLPGTARVAQAHLAQLDAAIERFNASLSPLREFVLPGGSPDAARAHVARTVCRRAERSVVTLARAENEIVSDSARIYLNRLSDLLFVLGRVLNRTAGGSDVLWEQGKNR